MTLTQPWLPVVSRIAAALLGGYGFTWGLSALIVASNLATGGDYDEGLVLAYLVAFLWAFSAKSLVRIWCVLAGGGAVMTGAAWALTQAFGLQH
jgi:hypothetical protein